MPFCVVLIEHFYFGMFIYDRISDNCPYRLMSFPQVGGVVRFILRCGKQKSRYVTDRHCYKTIKMPATNIFMSVDLSYVFQ